ncbi:hypothetical protein [Rhodoblastus sp.]|uniref:hypothetical protein n=1 Tax=Rhodoblastus sp. TaxID=1962975 RepID=UPI00261E5A15|nr:hypothetical protein [Rhodoblastus sp.]
MHERKKALERLLAVKTKMRELEEARLAAIERQKHEAAKERRALLGFLGGAAEKDPLLLKLACRRVASVERGAAALEARAVSQRERVVQRNAQRRALEKLVREEADKVERDEEKRRLLDLGESLAAIQQATPPTSLP